MTDNPDLEDKKKSRRRFSPRTPDEPPLWTKHYSENYEEFYFYNNVTKESVWMNTPEGMEIAKMLKGDSPQKDEKTQKILMAIDKMRKGNLPQEQETPLKIGIPTPPTTPPPKESSEKEKGTKSPMDWNDGKWAKYDPNKPLKFDQYGWPITPSPASDKSEKSEARKSSSSDKLGWDVKPGNLPLAEDYQTIKEVPKELFQPVIFEEKQHPKALSPPQKQFDILVKKFYDTHPYVISKQNKELEVKFGTKGIKSLTRNDYDNVIKKLKSFGFTTTDNVGNYYLRINCEFLDPVSGKFRLSDVRTEISGLQYIQDYCNNNDIKEIYSKNFTVVSFTNKKLASIDKERIFPVDFNDFNFRVTFNYEDEVKQGIKNYIMENWKKSKKVFRYLNRVTFTHPDFPVLVDISIVKNGNKEDGARWAEQMKRVYTTQESNVFNNPEIYQIEIEIDNKKIGPGTRFNNPAIIVESLRKVIKYVLGGLQGTNYPVSYPEQRAVLETYMRMIWKEQFDPSKRIDSKYFIGPSSKSLQRTNIAVIDENSNIPNIRKGFVVTEKADGDRHLMFVNENGKIFLINSNMDVIFTGAKTEHKDCFNCLLDGELILHDKQGKFINLYAIFDIYYYKKDDVRAFPFMLVDKKADIEKTRFYLLQYITNSIKAVSITNVVAKDESSVKSILEKFKQVDDLLSPIRIVSKEFYPMSDKQTIFNGCDIILSKVEQDRFEYETDGLIFTHAHFGVGSDKIGDAGPKTRITWDYSFKWKPPFYNTIDFLITTIKNKNGDDEIKPLFEDGINSKLSAQLSEYKTIELRCGFDEKKDGFINPCQDIIDDKLPEFKNNFEDRYSNNYVPRRFYPTEPYDPNAGICKIMLRTDDSGVKQMFSEENEVFQDNTIVECRYDFSREEGWKWVPLRVRHDKTAEYRKGQKQYGNSFETANSNWKSIHPAGIITEDMIRTGQNIPDIIVSEDVYYNTPSGKLKTESMKNFHNLYVKKLLIKSVSKQGDTLIDYACGKGGDLPKWIASRLSFVFGIDISKDNLENRLNGSCARYLNMKKQTKFMPYALFVNGNSAYNIRKGDAMLNDKAKQITSAVFGNGPKEADKIGKGVARQYGVGEDGFNVSSCQFALHYFFENPDTLQGFLRNVAECTKLNGYFIGTAYDGKLVFNLLKKVKTGESIKIIDDGKKIWEITKGYGADNFEDDSSSIGYRIDVYQESINQNIQEFLVNFDYLNRVFEAYGFKIIDRDEAQSFGLPEGSGLFSELFNNMLEEIKKNKFKEKDYENAANMTAFERKISFLNRYFVYKKIREVNTEKVELELGEYQEFGIIRNAKETRQAIDVAKDEVERVKPKVRKLSKKLLLVAATEAIDEQLPAVVIEKPEKDKKEGNKIEKICPPGKVLNTKTNRCIKIKPTATLKNKKKLVIESDSDEE
jgi:mRNA (guanine-N7-)-methyltransferase